MCNSGVGKRGIKGEPKSRDFSVTAEGTGLKI